MEFDKAFFFFLTYTYVCEIDKIIRKYENKIEANSLLFIAITDCLICCSSYSVKLKSLRLCEIMKYYLRK